MITPIVRITETNELGSFALYINDARVSPGLPFHGRRVVGSWEATSNAILVALSGAPTSDALACLRGSARVDVEVHDGSVWIDGRAIVATCAGPEGVRARWTVPIARIGEALCRPISLLRIPTGVDASSWEKDADDLSWDAFCELMTEAKAA
jgi:hypothetical protein